MALASGNMTQNFALLHDQALINVIVVRYELVALVAKRNKGPICISISNPSVIEVPSVKTFGPS